MFGAWMASATRGPAAARLPAPRPAPVPAPQALDVVLCVLEAGPSIADEVLLRRLAEQLAPAPVQRIVWGASPDSASVAGTWARVPHHPPFTGARHPLSAHDLEHPAARLYESLAQSLLAGLGSKGGTHG
jgi:hypothetical protein